MAGYAIEKLAYLGRQIQRRLLCYYPRSPNCGSARFARMDTKAVVTELRECQDCHLYYRFPTDSVEDNRSFYQHAYKQGFTTDLPDDATLAHLKSTKFTGHEKSYAALIDLIYRLGLERGARIFDYGCSWGFGSWQFADAGYEVSAFEISVERAAYARTKLSVDCADADALEKLEARPDLYGSFDVFFSNHVMEHVPSPTEVITLAKRLVKAGGLFVAITPNGSLGFREVAPQCWHQFWGKVHPNLISDTFWAATFREHDHFIGALPSCVAHVGAWARSGGKIMAAMSDPELLCAARLNV